MARKAVIVVVVLAWLLTPALACIAPLAEMAMDKCCPPRLTANCGPMQMPDAKSCCAVPPSPEQDSLAARAAAQAHLLVVDQVAQSHPIFPNAHAVRLLLARGDSPPGPPPGSISVLRI